MRYLGWIGACVVIGAAGVLFALVRDGQKLDDLVEWRGTWI